MQLKDNASFHKFEIYAQQHVDCPITQDAYHRVQGILASAPVNDDSKGFTTQSFRDLRKSCEALEKGVRVLWACAVSTGQVDPPLWDYLPDYEASIEYFNGLTPLQMMALTEKHNLLWEKTVQLV
jgi:hypothetical protein